MLFKEIQPAPPALKPIEVRPAQQVITQQAPVAPKPVPAPVVAKVIVPKEPKLKSEHYATIATLGVAAFAIWLLLRTKDYVAGTQGEAQYMSLVQDAANTVGIPASILAGHVQEESNWNNRPNSESATCKVPCIASSACAIGLAQMEYATAKDRGFSGSPTDLCDPANNLLYAARQLKWLFQQTGNWHDTALAYRNGIGNVRKGNVSTKALAYADRVLSDASSYQNRGVAGLGGLPVTGRSARGRLSRRFA